jgi:ABC-type phosphate transport system substrate-binding protein
MSCNERVIVPQIRYLRSIRRDASKFASKLSAVYSRAKFWLSCLKAAEFLSSELQASAVKTKVTPTKANDGTTFQIFDVSGDVGGKQEVIHIVSNGSGKAFSALTGRRADLGMSSRPYSTAGQRIAVWKCG